MSDAPQQPLPGATPHSDGTAATWGSARASASATSAAAASPAPGLGPHASPVHQFLGGSPGAVLVRLLFLSLIVGALLLWLDIHPADILYGLQRFVWRLYNLGFGAIQDMLSYVVAGAVIVVPIWLVVRLMNMRSQY